MCLEFLWGSLNQTKQSFGNYNEELEFYFKCKGKPWKEFKWKMTWSNYICFCIQYVALCCFGWSTWRKSGLTQTSIWKKEGHLNILSRWLWYSSSIEYQNSASGGFLKISCDMKFEIISVKFDYSVILKFTIQKKLSDLPCTLNEYFTCGFCNIKYWSSGKFG